MERQVQREVSQVRHDANRDARWDAALRIPFCSRRIPWRVRVEVSWQETFFGSCAMIAKYQLALIILQAVFDIVIVIWILILRDEMRR